MKAFLAILLVSGYNTVPRRRLYWSGDPDVRNEAIVTAMQRDRFDEIMRYFHLRDNAHLDATDKFAKVRPLFTLLNERFQKYFQQQENFSVDESMVPYFGKHSAKQFIKGKPIRYGYKNWVLATSLEYAINLIPYQGATTVKATPGLGMGGQVVIDLISVLPHKGFHLTFDLFTSLALSEQLTTLGFACTGTIRANRVGNCPFLDTKAIEKQPRGSYDFKTDKEKGVILTRWHNNNVVTLLSNKYGIEPVGAATRWSKQEGKRVGVPQPNIVKHYNATMGGVDWLDQNVGLYRIGINSKKWWWPLLIYLIDLCVQQTWQLYRTLPQYPASPKDQLEVKRDIAKIWLMQAPAHSKPGRKGGKYAAMDKRVPPEIRLDGKGHFIEKTKKQARYTACGMKCRQRCIKCQVGVHDRCFVDFHVV